MSRPSRWSGRNWLAIVVVVVAAFFALAAWRWQAAASARGQGPLLAQVYVWQRAWTLGVKEAVSGRGASFGRIVVLGRQIQWENEQPKVMRIGVDWESLKRAGAEVGGAVRIGAFGGRFERVAGVVAQNAADLVVEARENGVHLIEVQLDFDAATSRLADYGVWLSACQWAVRDVPVTFTALPSWLGSASFAPLARQAGGYVLQVHGLERPRTACDPMVLCDPDAAKKAVEKAGRIGVPFRVALPTYGYVVAFDPQSEKFLGMAAEGAPEGWGEGKLLKVVEARPEELARLAGGWMADRPAALEGILWYRMPVAGDQLNWRWPTLAAVMAGRVPAPARLKVVVNKSNDGLCDVKLSNAGEQDTQTAVRVKLRWQDGAMVAADGLGGFQMSPGEKTGECTLIGEGGWAARLAPGESRSIGWIRLSQEQEVQAHVEQAGKVDADIVAGGGNVGAGPGAIDSTGM